MWIDRAIAIYNGLLVARPRVLTDVTQRAHRGEVRRYAPRVAQVDEILIQPWGRRNDLRHGRYDLVNAACVDGILRPSAKIGFVVGLVLKVITNSVLALVLRRVERNDAVGKGEVVPFWTVSDGTDLGLKQLKATQ